MSWSVISTHFFNISRDGDSTTSLDSLFQCLTTLSVKKFFLISNLNLPWRTIYTLQSSPACCKFFLPNPGFASSEGTGVAGGKTRSTFDTGPGTRDKGCPFPATKDLQNQGWSSDTRPRAGWARPPRTHRLALFSFFRRRSLMLTSRR